MKRHLLALVLLAVAASAQASGIGLRWGSCEGYSNRNFACDVSGGAEVMVASFSPPGGVDSLTGVSAVGHISAADANVPAWWQVGRGSCRYGSLTLSALVSDEADCEDPWQGQGMGGFAFVRSDQQGMGFEVAIAVPTSFVQSVQQGRKYAAFKLLVSHQKSSGAGACAGCETPMCITLESVTLGQPNHYPTNNPGGGQRDIILTDGMVGLGGAGNVVTWQGGTPRCGAGASKQATWTQVKQRFHP